MLPEKGNLNDISPTGLLLNIFENSLSGILFLRQEKSEKEIYFNQGKFTWATSNAADDRLEKVLIDKELLTPQLIQDFKNEATSDEFLGKALVQKGMLTLEELVDASRTQLQRIVHSLLAWTFGSFQFLKDTLPDRLVNLNLDIPSLVYQIIQETTKIDFMLSEIGAMSSELIPSPDSNRIKKFNLSDPVKEVLLTFVSQSRVDEVLYKFPGEQKYTILKTVYFLLISRLLIRKGQEPDITTNIDEIHIHPDEKESQDNSYIFGALESEPPDDFKKEKEIRTPIPITQFKNEKSKRPHTLLILIVISLVLSSAILLLLTSRDGTPSAIKEESKSTAPIIPITEKKIVGEKKERPTASIKTGSQEKNATQTKVPAAVKPIPRDALAHFKKGDLVTAADLWKQEMTQTKAKYSILLELDCVPESVLNAFQQLTAKEPFFIIAKKKNENPCFLVLWGKYSNITDASNDLRLLPPYFWKQLNPPQVIELSPYQ